MLAEQTGWRFPSSEETTAEPPLGATVKVVQMLIHYGVAARASPPIAPDLAPAPPIKVVPIPVTMKAAGPRLVIKAVVHKHHSDGDLSQSSFDQPLSDAARDSVVEFRAVSPHSNEEIMSVAKRNSISDDLDEAALRGDDIYEGLRRNVETAFSGKFIMINIASEQYVVDDSLSGANKKYKQLFGDSPGWATRIGASIFADSD